MRQMFMPNEGGGLRQQIAPTTQEHARQGIALSAKEGTRMKETQAQQQKARLKRVLKKARSADYLNKLRVLDAGGRTLSQGELDALVNEISGSLGPLDKEIGRPIGIISKCYLGDDYEVHTLDMVDGVIEHYLQGQPLPGELEKYRGIAAAGTYEFIEVHHSFACAVRANGSVTVLEN